jgi:uncharacterized protein YkwD
MPVSAQQSRIHSEAMASGQVPFSHNGFEGRVKAIAKSIPYRSAAENVAYNRVTLSQTNKRFRVG